MGHVDVDDPALVEEGSGPGHRVVDDLVRHDDVGGIEAGPDPPDRGYREDTLDPGVAERPDVGPVVDPMRSDVVVRTVAGKERHGAPADLAEHEGSGRISEDGGRAPLTGDHEPRIRLEPRAADDRVGRHQPVAPSRLRPTQSRANW